MATRKQGLTARRQAAIERENRILDLLVQGRTPSEIGRAISMDRSGVGRAIERALLRRAKEMEPAVQQARVMYTERLMALWRAYYPLAVGEFVVEDPDGNTTTAPPDPRIGELMLKINDRLGAVAGGIAPPVTNQTNVQINLDQRDTEQQRILAALATVRAKQEIVSGTMVATGLAIEAGVATQDPGPPPVEKS